MCSGIEERTCRNAALASSFVLFLWPNGMNDILKNEDKYTSECPLLFYVGSRLVPISLQKEGKASYAPKF